MALSDDTTGEDKAPSDPVRKHLSWPELVESEFQDGCDDWWVKDRQRKRRLRRRPADNQFITALVRLGLAAVEEDPRYDQMLEDLLHDGGKPKAQEQ